MFVTRGFIFAYEAVRDDWEAKLMPALAENLRRRRKGRVGPSLVRWWDVYPGVGPVALSIRWRYLYRAVGGLASPLLVTACLPAQGSAAEGAGRDALTTLPACGLWPTYCDGYPSDDRDAVHSQYRRTMLNGC
jgi:hypothetical protein